MDSWSGHIFLLLLSPVITYIIVSSSLSGFGMSYLIANYLPPAFYHAYHLLKVSLFTFALACIVSSVFALSDGGEALKHFGYLFLHHLFFLGIPAAVADDPVAMWHGYSFVGDTVADAIGGFDG